MRHAYLIMAHNEFDILEKLLRLLDDERNDFYIHIDKKVSDFPFERFRTIPAKSAVYFTPRLDVRWADFSLTECQLIMLREARKVGYRYYHLLSGVDLPLKDNDAIHAFFEQHDGREFVHFCSEEQTEAIRFHVEYYHFRRLMRAPGKLERAAGYALTGASRLLYGLGLKRKWPVNIRLAYGSNWCSITDELAAYILEKEDWVRKHFRLTCISDELYIQTLVENSDFRRRLYHSEKDDSNLANVRCIDWKRGNPYVFRSGDFDELIASPCLFARKFSGKVDGEIIERIYAHFRKGDTA